MGYRSDLFHRTIVFQADLAILFIGAHCSSVRSREIRRGRKGHPARMALSPAIGAGPGKSVARSAYHDLMSHHRQEDHKRSDCLPL